jgi:MOSC domain-containing protein YiiM
MDAEIRPGHVTWIGLRPARHAPMRVVDHATLDPEVGVQGDHYAGRSGARQVSLITQEALAAIASYLGRDAVSPELLRRNLVLRGVNLLALKERRFRLGTALLEYAGECHPCSRMETLLGPGGYNAVRGQGGILARVIEAGAIRQGDLLERQGP